MQIALGTTKIGMGLGLGLASYCKGFVFFSFVFLFTFMTRFNGGLVSTIDGYQFHLCVSSSF